MTADTPYYAVFTKGGKRTHVAYNFDAAPRTIVFSDGVSVKCEPRSWAVK